MRELVLLERCGELHAVATPARLGHRAVLRQHGPVEQVVRQIGGDGLSMTGGDDLVEPNFDLETRLEGPA